MVKGHKASVVCWSRAGSSVGLLLLLCGLTTASHLPPEPFPDLHSFDANGAAHSWLSPDPLVNYTWSPHVNLSQLQTYRVDRPVSMQITPEETKISILQDGTAIAIHGSATLQMDWGVERAAWLEFTSPDLLLYHDATITASISEYNSPYPGKTKTPTRYGCCTFRLETNPELYEGVRFAWIHVYNISAVWHISSLSLVARVKPVNYTGSLSSSDSALTETWYTGAYTVRVTMQATAFGTILINRGDRVSIQGDGHPTVATALSAFSGLQDLIWAHLLRLNSGTVHGRGKRVVDSEIMAYELYWILTGIDYYMYLGDTQGFRYLVPDVLSILDQRIADFGTNPELVWMGWDDRLGDGWCSANTAFPSNCGAQAQYRLMALTVRVCGELSRAMRLAGLLDLANKYLTTAKRLGGRFRSLVPLERVGLHAATAVINAGSLIVSSTSEIDALFERTMTDSTTICSFANFNQFFVVQALGNAGRMEHALATVKLCWGTQLRLSKGCFWELYQPYWAAFTRPTTKAPTGASLCCPWASGVTAWLSRAYAGIQPVLPGFREFVAAPYVSATYPQVNATVPTPFGSLTVWASFTPLNESSWRVTVKVQSSLVVLGFVGIRTRLLVVVDDDSDASPCSYARLVAIRDSVDESSSLPLASRSRLKHVFAPRVLESLRSVQTPGNKTTFQIEAFYSVDEARKCGAKTQESSSWPGTGVATARRVISASQVDPTTDGGIPHMPPFPVPHYPARVSPLDHDSGGDGLLKYGEDGFLLFGFHENTTDLSHLPDYVTNVSVYHHSIRGWTPVARAFVGSDKNNTAYLPDPTNERRRALGWMGENINGDVGRGVIVDIHIDSHPQSSLRPSDDPRCFELSIYSVALNPDERHAVRVQDMQSMAVIAPTQHINSTACWLTISYHQSMRLRFLPIYATRVSALAFRRCCTDAAVALA